MWQKITRTIDTSIVDMPRFIIQVAKDKGAPKSAMIVSQAYVMDVIRQYRDSGIYIMKEKLSASSLGLVLAEGTPYLKHFNKL
jgi:hypothetical protein